MKIDRVNSTSRLQRLAYVCLAVLAGDTGFAQDFKSITTTDQIIGTWEVKDVTEDGELVTHTLELKQGTGENAYEQLWETSNATNTVIARSEAKLKIERAGKRMLAFNYGESRRLLPDEKSHDWRPSEMSVVVQRVGNQLYACMGLDQEMWIWRKVDGESAVVEASRLDVLKPLLKTYTGVHDHLGSEAYGASNAKQNIKSAGKLSPTGTVLVHEWTSLPLDAKPEDAFEARGVFSYSIKHKAIVKQYHTSTGVMMTGVLVKNDGDKMLWERTGEGPAGTIHELCQFDFSEPGVFKHKIISRSLNGVPTSEAGQLIILKQQD
jgi:hypothetical protein